MLLRSAILLAALLAAAMLVGALDRHSATVSHKVAMEAPRPIFETAHELQTLHMPCDWVQVRVALKEEFRCVNADGRK